MDRSKLEEDLAWVLNCHSVENDSNSPDFVLARYLIACLDAYANAQRGRQAFWQGTDAGGDTLRVE